METVLARKLLAGEISDGSEVTVDVTESKLAFAVHEPAREGAGAS
jgi:hypothetical protein